MDFYRFCQILNENMGNERPEDDTEYPRAGGRRDFRASLVVKNGVLHDTKKNVPLAAIPPQLFQGIVGAPNDTYTLDAPVVVSGDYYFVAGGWRDPDDIDDHSNEKFLRGEVEIYVLYKAILTNDRTKEKVEIPEEIASKLFGAETGFPYQVEYDDEVDEYDNINFTVR